MRFSGSLRHTQIRPAFLIVIEILSAAAFVFAILALVAGENTRNLHKASILTFNTSSVNADIANYLSQQNGGDSDVPLGRKVYDWYEVHYLAVCKGMWSNGVVGVENASTIQCEPKSAGYTFSLSSELAADTVPAAQNLFANWSYGTLQTEASMVLLAMGIGFMGLSLLAYLYCLITRPMLERADSLIALVIALVSHGIAVILLTNSSAEITVKAHKLTDLASVTLPVTLNAWQTKAFYVLIWMSVGFMWGAVPIAVIIALLVGGIFIPLLCEYERRSHEDRKFSAPLEPPKGTDGASSNAFMFNRISELKGKERKLRRQLKSRRNSDGFVGTPARH